MSAELGPLFRAVRSLPWAEFRRMLPAGSAWSWSLPTEPVLMRGAGRDWPSTTQWSFDRLRQEALRRDDTVDIQHGIVEQGHASRYTAQPLSRYLEALAHEERTGRERPTLFDTVPSRIAGDNAGLRSLRWSTLQRTNVPYLTLYELFAKYPRLRRELPLRQFLPTLTLFRPYAWIGPGGTFTGLHMDRGPNFLYQARGRKQVILFDVKHESALRPSPRFDWGSRVSHIDLCTWRPDPEAAVPEGIAALYGQYAELEPGDVLFIPRRWWHAVYARTPCISISAFALPPVDVIREGVPVTALWLLHTLRLYQPNNCTCHPERHNPFETSSASVS